jgi:branched-chain amino acid transport system substrate-binding protein
MPGVLVRGLLVGGLILAAIGVARAEDVVKIGSIYPLTGVAASAGNYAKMAIETGEDIVNSPHPGLEKLLLGEGKGLPNLKGAKIQVDFADHQGNPSVGQSQTLRLITEDKVVAMLGAYQSSVSFAAPAVAEPFGIP